MNATGAAAGRPRIRVTDVGEYIRHHGCERRFKLKIDRRAVERSVPFMVRFFNPLDPVLMLAGQKREDEWGQALLDAGFVDLGAGEDPDAPYLPWERLLELAAAVPPGTPAFGRQVRLEATVGAFDVVGNVDFLLLLWHDGVPHVRLVECKASRRDQTYHQCQVALYRLMLDALLRDTPATLHGRPVEPARIECVVARIDELHNRIQPILEVEPLDLTMMEADLGHLLAPGGTLDRIATTELDSLAFQIDGKCDDCVFNVNCLPESARQRRLELIGIDPSSARVLRAAGVVTLDDLARLDPNDQRAVQLRATPGFGENLEQLVVLARARLERLPGGAELIDAWPVEALPHEWQSQLPSHEIVYPPVADEVDERRVRLVRVYLEVNYDYVENRIGALAAHVTTSDGQLAPLFDADRRAIAKVQERVEVGRGADDRPIWETRPLRGESVVALRDTPWESDDARDTVAERALLEDFFSRLATAIHRVAGADRAPVHLYVWSSGEITRLVEGCERAGGGLLGHLRELLGCRETLEQLLFSSLGEEVDRRFALGWTGRGLSVVTSLPWFGQRFHWDRVLDGEIVSLDRVFEQDIFDFRTTLRYRDGQWGDPDDPAIPRVRFEIRSRFRDTLKAPYWRARWGQLRELPARNQQERNAIARYERAAEPGMLELYLRTRVEALRWVEERVAFKNAAIVKPELELVDLERFTLGVDDVRAAAIDFLQLDQHVSVRAWLGEHLLPPANRVAKGRTIPLWHVMPVEDDKERVTATIDPSPYGLTLDDLARTCSFGVGSFVRLNPHNGQPNAGQSLGALLKAGSTCVIEELDWETGEVLLAIRSSKASRYLLSSFTRDNVCMPYATLDESPSDFVGGRVEGRLDGIRDHHVYRWLDPQHPRTPAKPPLDAVARERFEQLLTAIRIDERFGYNASQIEAVLDGLDTRVQALQGPPGTGKTTTTALAVLTRIVARCTPGDVVVIAANTHTAVDTLLLSIAGLLPEFVLRAGAHGTPVPPLTLVRLDGRDDLTEAGIEMHASEKMITPTKQYTKDGVLVVAGTTNAVLKLANKLDTAAQFKHRGGFRSPLLVIDEASMMVFPHFLALATVVVEDGDIMLAGDQRQLAPIVAHDWENEDRLPVTLYRPHMSAIETVQRIAASAGVSPHAVRRSSLRHTYRLPGVVRELVARLYQLDKIDLEGNPHERQTALPDVARGWGWLWDGWSGLCLVLHDERESRQSNSTEATLIREMLAAGRDLPLASIAVVTPHRAQRTLLSQELAAFDGPVDVIDTVERLQGNERPTIIVSGTASDPASIAKTAEFILGLNRSNVAFSRAKARLIVVCSEALLNHIAADLEHYREALLWKALREVCCTEAGIVEVGGHRARVLVPNLAPRTTGIAADD